MSAKAKGESSVSAGGPGCAIADLKAALGRAVTAAIQKAQGDVCEALPGAVIYQLEMRERNDRALTFDEVLVALCMAGRFPRIVDVAVRGVVGDATVDWLRPSGHPFVDNIAETWNDPPGAGPFKPAGLLLPPHLWGRPRPYSLAGLREAAPMWGPE